MGLSTSPTCPVSEAGLSFAVSCAKRPQAVDEIGILSTAALVIPSRLIRPTSTRVKGAHFCVITQTAIKIHRAKGWSIVARALAMAVWAVCITGSRAYDVRQVRNAPANTG